MSASASCGHAAASARGSNVPEPAVSNRSKTCAYSITSSARASSEGGTSRQSALAGLIADWSGLVDLVDGNDGKRAGPTRIVHAGHGIDGLTDLCDGKTVAWRDHAGST